MHTQDEGTPPSSWEELFDELVELPEAEREQRLRELEAHDPALAARLSRLLAADAESTSLFDRPTLGLSGSEVDVDPGLPPGTVIGPWRIVRLAGRGGMGEVYEAERVGGGFAQRVALKLVQRGMDSRAIVRRFERERQILARLEHPNLAHLLDGGKAPDGRPFFVLEWVDGVPITAYCRERGLDLAGRVRLVQTVCRAVDAAHRLLVVHRDLKPANILVTADGTVKLLDFGVAKLLSGNGHGDGADGDDGEAMADELTLTRLDARVLTPAYASPEQILGEPVSTATDVYSLGVLLYELVTGTLPHRRSRLALGALASAVEQETVKRPSAVLRQPGGDARLARLVTPDLDLIVLTALRRDPLRRYAGPLRLAEDLERFLSGRPIEARPADLGYRLRKFVGRNRVAVAAVALALAALVAGLAAALHQAAVARASARRAELVKSFLINIFQQSDPAMAGGGATLTARELLTRGGASLSSGLAGEPEVQADLFDALAQIEKSLGLWDPALAHARRALALRQAVLPAGDGRIGQSWTVLGEVQGDSGAILAARRSYETALALLAAAYGSDSIEAARAKRGLASVLDKPRETERALALLRQALATSVRMRGEDDPQSIATLDEVGASLVTADRLSEAEVAFRRVVALYARTLGPNNVRVAMARSDLAWLLDRAGKRKEAATLYLQAIASERAILGARHLALADTLTNYGIHLLGDTDYDGAERYLREALAIYGPDHYGYAQCLRFLGNIEMRREHYAEAADLLTHATPVFRQTLGERNSQIWRNAADLGYVHFRLGQVAAAKTELLQALAKLDQLSGPESDDVLVPLQEAGEVLTATGDLPQAITALRRERALEVKLFHRIDRRAMGLSDLLLARALLAQAAQTTQATRAGQPAQASRTAQTASSEGGGAASAAATAPVAAAQNQREARRLLDESMAIFQHSAPTNPRRGEALLLRGRLALEDGDRPLARQLLSAAEPLLAARKRPNDPDTRAARRLLARD